MNLYLASLFLLLYIYLFISCLTSDTGLAAHADRFYVHWEKTLASGGTLAQGKTHVRHSARSPSGSVMWAGSRSSDTSGPVAREEMHKFPAAKVGVDALPLFLLRYSPRDSHSIKLEVVASAGGPVGWVSSDSPLFGQRR